MKIYGNMPKFLSIILLLAFGTLSVNAQEILAKVEIDHRQIQGTNTSVFETLENSLTEFINNQKWTNDEYLANERIECSFFINLTSVSGSSFSGSLTVTARRPIYNASISTTTLNLVDNDLTFTYNEFDQLVFNRNSLTQDLTAVVGFYVYTILGIDGDTFKEMGGDAYYNIAMGIVNSAVSSSNLSENGWDRLGSKRNRNVFISELLSSEFKPLRKYLYQYHRLGLDVMAESLDQGVDAILDNLGKLEQIVGTNPASYTMLLFFDVKTIELRNIINELDDKEPETEERKKELVRVLNKLDPSRMQTYNALLN